ncbi:MAG: hypothetical protein HY434_01380 [Candidatus Liptonbacteria bacterium]|nr:hypothetical protein [Candidatus Liptonbacteria bacterium]
MAKHKKSKRQPNLHQELRHLGVMIEHVDDKVSLVAEQYGDIKKTLSAHTETLNTHTEMMGKLTIDVEIVKEDIEFIKAGFKRKVDVDEFAALERRVLLLEKRR